MRFLLLLLISFLLFSQVAQAQGATESSPSSWIRVNQLGYLPHSIKVAVLASKQDQPITSFTLHDAQTHKRVLKSTKVTGYGAYAAFTSTYRLDFSQVSKPGSYYLKVNDTRSPSFSIGPKVYDQTADFLLRYMRQQRCGFNPFLKDSCHTKDGFVVFHPDKKVDSTFIDATGGWHDASDYLQYVTTSANATFQLLFAYQQNPGAFGDEFKANGLPGANGIPDILDEAKWGLDWLLKMYPKADLMFNQIADDRDHAGYRLPNHDLVDYGKGPGKGRPVYVVTGQPQGSFNYQNRSTGVASTAGKFSSAFSLGAQVLAKLDPAFAKELQTKAQQAYDFGAARPGVSQTAPGRAPYFYEEDNWADDMELAAVQLSRLTGQKLFLNQAATYGRMEPLTPWLGKDTARHYQWYPFINLGHYYLASAGEEGTRKEFLQNLRAGLEAVQQRGQGNAFLMGVPFIWCSNNLVAGLATQAMLYRQLTGDLRFNQMEASLRDWLLGTNPWGTSMIIGLPRKGETPENPHSSLSLLKGYRLDGGLVDGPVYNSIYSNLKGLKLDAPDEFAPFQSSLAVYHDDHGDYSTNEPTMDGTASLSFLFSALQMEGRTKGSVVKKK
ncbi:glycoside hydrolase family 9 protein [Rufibacter glacialis]|uniref:Glycoside hydrolase family 9 protein n=1 Tax=Rufibacter glacialis TaxID=1259555 RepID=A0ABV4RBH2_9BACT|nr:glycoside hydrolase family 9 protein [Rufibacter glacialis]GGK70605.1 endoglucanase [Rufibacter glacialis]